MSIKIRPAISSDLSVLLEFEQKIIAFERPFDNSLNNGNIHYNNLLELIKSDCSEVLVAELDGQLIASGYSKIQNAKDYFNFTEYAYFGFMYVEPTFRGKGVNKLILEKLLEWTKTKNISEVRLEVYDQNIAAKNAYLKAGFKRNMLEMRLQI